jgi:PAS domain S-box-containing protein
MQAGTEPSPQGRELRILLLEDNPGDAALIEQSLGDAGLAPLIRRVESREAFFEALQKDETDIILSDYSLPSFSGAEALEIAHDSHPDIPFIFVSGAMGEELAIESLKQGAADYVFKDRLARLAPAVERALEEASLRSMRRRAAEAAKDSRDYLASIINAIADPVFVKDARHRYVLVNDAFVEFAGRSRDELLGKTPADFLSPQEAQASLEHDDLVLKTGRKTAVEHQTRDAAGRERMISEVKTLHADATGERFVVGCMRDLTERARIEEALRESGAQLSRAVQDLQRSEGALRGSRDYLDSIINTIADPVYVKDTLHRYVLVNEAFAKFLGRPRDQLVGQTTAAYFSSEATAAFLEQDDRVLKTGRQDAVEVAVQDGAGQARIVSAIKTLFADAEGQRLVVGCLRDITEVRTSEAVAQRARQEWERTFDTVPDLVAVLDNKHRIRRVNKAMAERLGLTPEDCVGRPCHELVHGGSHPPDGCPHALTCADGKEHYVEVHEDHLGGDFLVSTTPVLDERGQVAGSVHVARDITEAKKAEAGLQEAAKLRTDLISLINHEYANGLTNMKLALALLRGAEPGTPDPARSHALEVLDRAVEKLKGYTANFLNLHRMESGKFELAVQPIAIRSVLLDVLVTLRPMAHAKRQNLSLQTDFPEEMPVAVRADPDCLSLIINNLVNNAIKYTPEGGAIAIRVSLVQASPARVRFSIEDTGIGLSAQDRERILAGSYRTEEGKALAKGFGVGLLLVRKLLEQHGSQLEIKSEHGKGSRFYFYLPVWAEAPASQKPITT